MKNRVRHVDGWESAQRLIELLVSQRIGEQLRLLLDVDPWELNVSQLGELISVVQRVQSEAFLVSAEKEILHDLLIWLIARRGGLSVSGTVRRNELPSLN